jgi:Dockerin type I domain
MIPHGLAQIMQQDLLPEYQMQLFSTPLLSQTRAAELRKKRISQMSYSKYYSTQLRLQSFLAAILVMLPFAIRPQQYISASLPQPQAYTFTVQTGTPSYLQNFAHVEQGCNWLGVAGQVFDKNGQPISRMVVRVEGFLGNQSLDALGMTSLATAYGPGGYEIELSNEPLNSSGTLYIALFNLEGERVSEYIPFNTYSDCSKNLILINFQESSASPITPTVTPQPTSVTATGSLLLQGRPSAPHAAWITGVEFSFAQTGPSQPATTINTTTDQFGAYSLTNLPTGTYNIGVKGENTLRAILPATTLLSGQNQLPDIQLKSGDANDDNFVTAIDFSILAASFGECLGDISYNGLADFNNDQCVTAVDFSLLSANYGQQGD